MAWPLDDPHWRCEDKCEESCTLEADPVLLRGGDRGAEVSTALVTCPACGQKNRVPAAATGAPRCGSCREPLAWIAEAGDETWLQVVERSPLPVVVDFWAQWCGPCKAMGPVLEHMAADYAGRVKLTKIDVDSAPALSQRFGIQSIPTLVFFHRGEMVSRQVGAAGTDHLRRWIDGALSQLA